MNTDTWDCLFDQVDSIQDKALLTLAVREISNREKKLDRLKFIRNIVKYGACDSLSLKNIHSLFKLSYLNQINLPTNSHLISFLVRVEYYRRPFELMRYRFKINLRYRSQSGEVIPMVKEYSEAEFYRILE